MSDKYTDVTIGSGGGMGLWGHVDPDEAIEQTRQFYIRQGEEAVAALIAIGKNDVTVHHQHGPYAARNRKRVR